MRTNYVLCTWSGARRTPDMRVRADPAFYLKQHMKSLRLLRHSLDQITVMVPENFNEPPEFREFLNEIPRQVQNASVVVMERPNVGMSYGSMSDCYAKYRTEFDYYFFMEDDYVFTLDDFDKLHTDVMEADEKCGYLCGLAWALPGLPLHAGIANGVMRASALEAVFQEHNQIPHANGTNYSHNEMAGQVGQSQAILAKGFTLRDWKHKYRIAFRENEYLVKEFHTTAFVTLMRPL